jgi:hypothetical protein
VFADTVSANPAQLLLFHMRCVAAVLAGSSNAVQAQDEKQFNSVFMAMLSLPGASAVADQPPPQDCRTPD